MYVNQYYTHEKIPDKGDKVYILVEHYAAGQQKTIGVCTGVESVCVINSGMGMTGDIRKYIEDMLGTDKTIECISLTGQPDNVGASALFDVVYITPEEEQVYAAEGCNDTARRAMFESLAGSSAETMAYAEKLMIGNKGLTFKTGGDGIKRGKPEVGPHMFDAYGDGYMFHLGGTVVEMASLPAQSEGQLIAICPTCCISFVGRAIEPVTQLDTLDRAGLQKYADMLERVLDYTTAPTPYSEGLGMTPHVYYYDASSIPMSVANVKNVLAACREVLSGKTRHDIPAGGKSSLRMHFVENNGIIYDVARIG